MTTVKTNQIRFMTPSMKEEIMGSMDTGSDGMRRRSSQERSVETRDDVHGPEYKTNDLSGLDASIEISKEIFHPSPETIQEYHNKEDWIHKIKNGGLLLTVYVEDEPAGFVICYIKEENSLHIWVGGVVEKYRGQGLWDGMYKKIEEFAQEKKYARLTLNTYRDKFPVMYRFADRHGFILYKTEMKDDMEKSFFEKELGQIVSDT